MGRFIRLTCLIISIHAPREGGDGQNHAKKKQHEISIHAPREGGDYTQNRAQHRRHAISIHAPREGGDKSLNFLSISKV